MEEYYMEYEEITFNDIPRAMANILRKCDLLEQSIDVLREEIRQTNNINLTTYTYGCEGGM